MAMQFRWTGHAEDQRIADIRARCYGETPSDFAKFMARTQADRFANGDVLLASQDDQILGTTTSLSMNMSIRGTLLPCQGVAWVGSAKSVRRRRFDGDGLATLLMKQTLNKAREREQPLSALMPFRTSYYEHSGYSAVERQNVWTIPLSIIPKSDTSTWRDFTDSDHHAMVALRKRQTLQTHGDIITDDQNMTYWINEWKTIGQTFVSESNRRLNSYAVIQTLIENDKAVANVYQRAWDSPDALRSLIGFLGTLKDQYSFARIVLPTEIPVNWLLDEKQLPHRRVDHPHATVRTIARMQVRILDHIKVCNAITTCPGINGSAVVAIIEPEGHTSTIKITLESGKMHATPSTQTPDITMPASTWPAIALGELHAWTAYQYGIIQSTNNEAVSLLGTLNFGPTPFCVEYF